MHKFYFLLLFTMLSFPVFAQAPSDEDFSDNTPTNYTNLAQTLTNDGVIYFQDGVLNDGQYIEIFEALFYNLRFPAGSNALVYNAGQADGGTHYGFKSQNGAEFRLASMVIDISGIGGFATQYIIRGYRNGIEQVTATVNFATSATYGSVSYTKNADYYMGGTLSFSQSAEWKNIDEVRFYWNNNAGMQGAIKSIDFEEAIPGTLPVNLVSYKASAEKELIKLQWETVSENNNSAFIISRSTNGKNFDRLATITAKGNISAGQQYFYNDRSPSSGLNYYKLEQMDNDGKLVELGIKTIAFKLSNTTPLSVYPNPAINEISAKFSEHCTRLELINLSGRVIESIYISPLTNAHTFNVHLLPKGIYFIKAYLPTGSSLSKFVKI